MHAQSRTLVVRLDRKLNKQVLALMVGLAALVAGCSEDKPACNPGDAGCSALAYQGGDPRFVGDGMRGDALPHWPMFRHDAQHSGKNAIAPAATQGVMWTFQTESEIWSSPAVGLDGTVYIGSNDKRLYAIGKNGKLKWAVETMGVIFLSPAVA